MKRRQIIKQFDQASRGVNEATQEVSRVCGASCTVTLPGGVILVVDPAEVLLCDQRKVEEIIRKKIPVEDLEGINSIALQGVGKDDTAGEYDREKKRIDDWYPPEIETIKHEIGHHVYCTRLTDELRRQWKSFWDANKAGMPTDYARENEEEGFCEVYEFLRGDKKLNDAVRGAIGGLVRPNPVPKTGVTPKEGQ